MKQGRNAPCICGSGNKYKHCCESKIHFGPSIAPEELNQLVALFQAGRFSELESRTHLLLGRYPGSGLGWKLFSAALQIQGKDALHALEKAAELLPKDAEAHNNLGNALQDIGQLQAAVTSYRRALKISPNDADVCNNLGTALQDLRLLDQAVASYRRALALNPDYAEAYNNLGIALQDLGQLDSALASYRRALKIKPDYAQAHCGLGIALKNLGKLDDAVASYQRALEIKPDYAEAYNNLGNTLKDLGQLDEAVVCYHQALAVKPNYAEARNNLGSALQDIGQFVGAIASHQQALEIKPDYAEAHCGLGNALLELGQLDGAVASYRRALEIQPDYAEARNNLGNAFLELGQLDEALISYRRALEIQPDYAEAYNNLGNVLKDLGQLEEAVASYRRALDINTNFAEAYSNLGNALKELGQLDSAVASFHRALELRPDYAEAYNNLGNALKEFGNLDEVVSCYNRALEINPSYANAHNNLGIVLQELGQFDSAITSYRRALEVRPDDAESHSNYAYLLLSLGEFERGWQEYEWRDAKRAVERRAPAPLPKVKSLLPFTSQGKRILLCYEQGIGEEILFLRFAHVLREKAQWVGYWSTPKVQSLLERSACVDQVASQFDTDLRADLVIPVGDLPWLLGCHSIEAIPSPLMLSPTNRQVAKVHQHLSELGLIGQRLLGVTWRAGLAPVPGQRKTLFKRIGLDLLADAIKVWKGAIVVLQRKPEAGEIEQLRSQVSCPVYDFSDYNDDLEAMLAALDVLDDYVGVSNTNMHLMAGLGKTARVMVPSPAEWRWMARGDQSPWFPGFSLYRQTVAGDWKEALAGLSCDLSKHPK